MAEAVVSNAAKCEFESHRCYEWLVVRIPIELLDPKQVLVEQSGVLATLSRWRSWVQIPSGTLFIAFRSAKATFLSRSERRH